MEAMKAMGQVFLLTIEADSKGYLENGGAYVLLLEAPGPPEPQSCGTCLTQDKSWLRTTCPIRLDPGKRMCMTTYGGGYVCN
jgi:hypothetical protein